MHPSANRVAILALVVFAGLLFAGLVFAGSAYELEVDTAVSTPAETVEIEGSEYPITGVATLEPDDSLTVSVTSDTNYRVFLYNTDGQVEDDTGTLGSSVDTITVGDQDADINTTGVEPGTYMLSLEPRGEGRQAVYPLVVEGYDLSISLPSSVTVSDEIEVTATVEQTVLEEYPSEVDVAIWDGDDVTRFSLEQTGEGTYSTVLDSGTFEEGSYKVYGGIPDDGTTGSYQTALAVDNGGTLTVTADSSDDDSSDDDSNSDTTDDGSSSDDGESDDTDENGDESESEAGNESSDEPIDDDSTDETSEAVDDDGTDADDSDGENGDSTDEGEDDSVIERNETQANDDQRTEDDSLGTAGFGIIGAGILLTIVVFFRINRHHG